MQVSRRDVLIGGIGATCGCGLTAALRGLRTSAEGPHPGPDPSGPAPAALTAGAPSAQQSLELLMAGNTRFASGRPKHPHESREWREAIAAGQHPYAVILGCSDSRVSPEVIFDEGLGELFVVRQAGHVADDDTLGSIEFAVGQLRVPLVVVLGHEACGAVRATVGAVARDDAIEGHVLRLVDDITPAVTEAQNQPGHTLDTVVRANIRQVVRRLRNCQPVLRPRERRGELRVVGAYYPLRTGLVEWLTV